MTLGMAANASEPEPHTDPHVPALAGARRLEGNAAVVRGPGPVGESMRGEGVNAFRSG